MSTEAEYKPGLEDVPAAKSAPRARADNSEDPPSDVAPPANFLQLPASKRPPPAPHMLPAARLTRRTAPAISPTTSPAKLSRSTLRTPLFHDNSTPSIA